MNKLGIRFASKKQQALLCGDTSGSVIHPYFIPAIQAVGMYYCDDIDSSPAIVRLQARYAQMAFEQLKEIFDGRNWELQAQVALWTAAASFTLSRDNFTLLYTRKGCQAINTAGLQYVPTCGRPPEFSETLHEKLSVLSQAIYFENFLFLTCGKSEPTMTTRIEKEFRCRLPVRPTSSSSLVPRPQRTFIGSLSGVV